MANLSHGISRCSFLLLLLTCLSCIFSVVTSSSLRASSKQRSNEDTGSTVGLLQSNKGSSSSSSSGSSSSNESQEETSTGTKSKNIDRGVVGEGGHVVYGSGSGGLEYAIERQESYTFDDDGINFWQGGGAGIDIPDETNIDGFPMSPPFHPYLSKGSFSITHGNTYQSDTSPYPSFTADDQTSIVYDELDDPDFPSDPITLVYSNDNKVLWGSTFQKIIKVQRDLPNGELRIIGEIDRSSRNDMDGGIYDNNNNNRGETTSNSNFSKREQINTREQLQSNAVDIMQQVEDEVEMAVPVISEKRDNFHGAYSFVDVDNIYYTTYPERIEAYTDSIPGDSTSPPVRLPKMVKLPKKCSARPNAYFRGLSMTHDGYIIFATSNGFIGAVDRHSMETIALLDLAEATIEGGNNGYIENSSTRGWQAATSSFNIDDITKEVEISNNIAVDEKGGIYVVTSKAMNRIQWETTEFSIDFNGNVGGRLYLDWSTPYKTSETLITGRLGRGSGTSPTIIGDPKKRQFVCIGDGSTMMNVNFFDTVTGELAGSHPVTFGDPNALTSTTEQSLVGYEYKIMVTNNNYRTDTTLQRFFASPMLNMNEEFIAAVPVVLGDAPKGLEQFEIDPVTNEVKSVWANTGISIPNGISMLSIPNRIVYGIGKRDSTNNGGNGELNGWTLEGVDWDTGETLLTVPYGRGVAKNSFYAGAEIGPDGEIISGTLGGLVRFRYSQTV